MQALTVNRFKTDCRISLAQIHYVFSVLMLLSNGRSPNQQQNATILINLKNTVKHLQTASIQMHHSSCGVYIDITARRAAGIAVIYQLKKTFQIYVIFVSFFFHVELILNIFHIHLINNA